MPPRGRPTLVVLSLVTSSSVASFSSASSCGAAACRSLVLAASFAFRRNSVLLAAYPGPSSLSSSPRARTSLLMPRVRRRRRQDFPSRRLRSSPTRRPSGLRAVSSHRAQLQGARLCWRQQRVDGARRRQGPTRGAAIAGAQRATPPPVHRRAARRPGSATNVWVCVCTFVHCKCTCHGCVKKSRRPARNGVSPAARGQRISLESRTLASLCYPGFNPTSHKTAVQCL